MAKLQVILNEQKDVLGTLVVAEASGQGAPERFGILAGPGQDVVEIDVDDAMSTLDPVSLHSKIKAEYLNK